MKVKIMKETDERLEFSLDGAALPFANTLRRFCMSQVSCMAIDSITIYENNSSSFDEYLGNRIGQVPLKSPANHSPKGGFSLLSLDKPGPCAVYSSDLKSHDSSVKPAIPNIPLLRLREGQSVRLEAKAVPGTGANSAKFQVSIAAYERKGDDSFSFMVESFHQFPAKKLVLEASKLLEEKADEFAKEAAKAGKE